MWALLFNGVAVALVFRPSYRRLEIVFLVFLAVLSVSFLGSALWVGFDAGELAKGLVRFEMPGRHGTYDPWHVALAMVGAVGGSLMNLVYPYFLEAKGWRGPQYRRVQLYDLLLGIVVMIVLNLAVWILGAELLFPDRHIEKLEDLPNLLTRVLGESGGLLFYAGLFAAVYTSVIGHAVGLGCLGSHAWLRWRAGPAVPIRDPREHRSTAGSRSGASSRRWSGRSRECRDSSAHPDGEQRAGRAAARPRRRIVVDHRQCTAHRKQYRNRPWENFVMAVLFLLSVYFAWQAVRNLWRLAAG